MSAREGQGDAWVVRIDRNQVLFFGIEPSHLIVVQGFHFTKREGFTINGDLIHVAFEGGICRYLVTELNRMIALTWCPTP